MKKFFLLCIGILSVMSCSTSRNTMEVNLQFDSSINDEIRTLLNDKLDGVSSEWILRRTYEVKPMRYGRENGEPVRIYSPLDLETINVPEGTTALRIYRDSFVIFKDVKMYIDWYEEAVEDIEVERKGTYTIDSTFKFRLKPLQ